LTLEYLSAVRHILEEAIKRGWKLFLAMAGCNALFILLGLVLSPTAPVSASSPPSQPAQLPGLTYVVYQMLLHVVTGFAAGAVSLDPAVALVGGVVGPLVDFDHIGFFAGLPVEARVGHSLVLVALIVLLDSRLHLWGRGTRNLFLFLALEYSVHFAVAPPGFPLLSPLTFKVFHFSRAFPAAFAVLFAVAFLFDSMGSRMRAAR
jgi:hypothetical protein